MKGNFRNLNEKVVIMPSDLQDREKTFGIKLGWNQLKSTIRKNRKERRKTKPLFCIKNTVMLSVQRSKISSLTGTGGQMRREENLL